MKCYRNLLWQSQHTVHHTHRTSRCLCAHTHFILVKCITFPAKTQKSRQIINAELADDDGKWSWKKGKVSWELWSWEESVCVSHNLGHQYSFSLFVSYTGFHTHTEHCPLPSLVSWRHPPLHLFCILFIQIMETSKYSLFGFFGS